jgi:hypothetical protein
MAQAGRFHDRVLGTMTVVGGLLASQVIRGDGAGPQLAYALILNTAVVALASTRRWPELLLWVGGGTALQLIGFATLHANPEHQAAALAGITLLTLPYAIVLARRGPADGLGMTALGVGALYVALAAPWTPALDEVFFDPRSGLIANTEGSSPLRAAAGALAVMVPLWLAARRSRSAIAAGVVTVAGVFPLLGFVSGWPAEELARSIVPVAMLGLGATIFVGDRASGRGLIPLLFLAPALLPLIEGAPATLTVGLGAVALITAIAGFTSTTGAASTIALASTAVAAAAIASHEDPPWALPALLVGLVGLHALPTLRTWPDEPTPWLPWVGALAAPTAFMPAGYLWWSDQLGDGVIGLLPLCSAAATLVIAAGLVLAGRITVESTVFAVAVLGILGGVTLALPMQLQTRWLTVGWALESSALAIMALRLRHPLLRWTSVLLALAVAARLLLNPWALAWGDASGWPILNWTLYTWGLPTICLLVTAGALRRGTPEGSPFLAFVPLLQVLAMLTGFALVNVQVSDAFQASGPLELAGRTMLQGMVRSLSWGAYGIGLLVVGLVLQSRMTRILGFAFILLGALKVCLYDLWSLPGLIRVGSLLGLGFFLMIAAFLFERLVLRERTTPKGE